MLRRIRDAFARLAEPVSSHPVTKRFIAHHATTLAASISYYALLALFPAVIALTALAALIFDEQSARTDVVDFLIGELPLRETDGRGDVEELVNGVADNAGAISIVGVTILLFSASALMSALRTALTIAFEVENPRSYFKGKALDILAILGLGLLMAVSVLGTLLINLADDAKEELGIVGDAIDGVLGFASGLLPIAVTALVFAILLTLVPRHRAGWRPVLPAIVLGTAGFEIAKRGFGLYLDHFSNYAAVYGSLGAVIAFLVFVYLAALVLLLAAEYAAVRLEEMDARPSTGA